MWVSCRAVPVGSGRCMARALGEAGAGGGFEVGCCNGGGSVWVREAMRYRTAAQEGEKGLDVLGL